MIDRRAAGLVLGVALLAGTAGPAAAALKIEDVGLQGWSSAATAVNRIRVDVANDRSLADAFELEVEIASSTQGLPSRRASRFRAPLQLGPGEARTLDIPMILGINDTVTATLRDAQGEVRGRDQRHPSRTPNALVVLICESEPACQDLQSRIAFAGADEDRVKKRQSLNFAVVREPATPWWAYAVASVVVVARPAAPLSPAQRDALETYARQGGRLVIVDEMGGGAWLDSYAAAGGDGGFMGAGRLHRVRSLPSRGIEEIFAGPTLATILERHSVGTIATTHDEVSWTMNRLGTSLQVPRVSWLLGWLGAYIVVATVVNFAILRRLERREWAWITIPAIAVVFAGLLYTTATARQPGQTRIDEAAVYWMDDRSPWAAGEIATRVFAVTRRPATLTVAGDAILTELPAAERGVVAALRTPSAPAVIEMRSGERQSVRLALERGAFSDLVFRTARKLPGTVRRVDQTRIVNESGLDFTQAFLVDAQSVRVLGPLKAGATVDLAAAPTEPLARHAGRRFWRYNVPMGTSAASTSDGRVDPALDADSAFSPLELIGTWPRTDPARALGPRAAVFLGRAERSTLEPQLDIEAVRGRAHVIVVVSLARQP